VSFAAPTTVEIFPAAHAVQEEFPMKFLNVPAPQGVHTPFVNDMPVWHTQADMSPTKGKESLLAGHKRHCDLLDEE